METNTACKILKADFESGAKNRGHFIRRTGPMSKMGGCALAGVAKRRAPVTTSKMNLRMVKT